MNACGPNCRIGTSNALLSQEKGAGDQGAAPVHNT